MLTFSSTFSLFLAICSQHVITYEDLEVLSKQVCSRITISACEEHAFEMSGITDKQVIMFRSLLMSHFQENEYEILSCSTDEEIPDNTLFCITVQDFQKVLKVICTTNKPNSVVIDII